MKSGLPFPELPSDLEKLYRSTLLVDRRRFAASRRTLAELLASNAPEQEKNAAKQRLQELMQRAAEHSYAASADALKTDFPPELPITAAIPAIRDALRASPVVIVCGSTGSGKTTQLPKAALLEAFGRVGRIGCTQPRRIAATSLARRFAAETGAVCGREVGYKVRFDDHTGAETSVKFMTDGILLAETVSDRDLLQYDCLILDEVHERSLNIDFLLGYVRMLLRRRRDLRVIVSSATLAAERLSEFFDGAPVIEVEGRLFPVEDLFLEPGPDEDLSSHVRRGCEFLGELDPDGDILVFLPGEREIRETAAEFAEHPMRATEVLPLFGRLGAGEQGRIFQPGRQRRIILATNVAETSITIPRIHYVVDSGLVRLSRYNPRSGVQQLQVESVSKASADQRRGRCGRLRDGVCVRLYSKHDYESLEPYTAPEIQRSGLAGVLLRMAELKLPRIEDFPLLDPPNPALIREGRRTLIDLGAFDARGRITELGHRLAALPIDPNMGRILLAGAERRVLPQMIVIAAFLSLQDPRERPFEEAKSADAAHRKYDCDASDFIGILKLWKATADTLKISKSALRRLAQSDFLNYRRLVEWVNLCGDLADLLRVSGDVLQWQIDPEAPDAESIHKCLMTGLPRRLAFFDPEKKAFVDRDGRAAVLFPGSALAARKKPPRWILSFTVVETARVFCRCNAEVEPEWLEECAPALCTKVYDMAMWNEQSGFVTAREKVMAGGLLIHAGRRRHYGPINPVGAREIFIREALVPGRANLPECAWLRRYNQFLRTVHDLEIRMRRPDSLLNPDALFDHFDRVLPPFACSTESLKTAGANGKNGFAPEPDDVLYVPWASLHLEEYPDRICSNGVNFRLSYVCDPERRDDGVTLHATENELASLGRHVPEYLVPGLLRRKLELLLRAVPRACRKNLPSTEDCIDLFLAGGPEPDLPLFSRFSAFLDAEFGIEIDESQLEREPIPASLTMKIALHDEDGSILALWDELPEDRGARPGPRLPSAIGKRQNDDHPSRTWPSNRILNSSGKTGFAALTVVEDDGVVIQNFASEREAQAHHDAAICRLYRNACSSLIRLLKKPLRLPRKAEMTLFSERPEWKDDVVDHAIRQCADAPFLVSVRSEAEFDAFVEESRSLLSDRVDEVMALLDGFQPALERIETLRKRVPSDLSNDVAEQLKRLFRPGFLRNAEALARYPVYLKALGLRLERAALAPAKDRVKGEKIEPFVRKFQNATAHSDLDANPALSEFFLLLEEARLTAYTPEIPARLRTTPEQLRAAWSKIATD